MQSSKTLDWLYKCSVTIGIIIIAISAYMARKHYYTQEQRLMEISEAAILIHLDLQSLAEQLLAIESAVNQNSYSRENETEETTHSTDFSEAEMQKLQEDAKLLKQQIASTTETAKSLQQAKTNTRNRITGLMIILTIALTLGSVLVLLGTLGWVYHIKIYRERRDQERTKTT